MPPNNFLVPASATPSTDEGNSNDQQKGEASTSFLNRKNKNVLNIAKGLHHTTNDFNGNYIDSKENEPEYRMEPVWRNIICFVFLHYGFIVGVLYLRFNLISAFHIAYGTLSGFGITAGAHRLWAHGAFKANFPLRVLLAYFQTMAFQNTIYEWVRDHRAHHKFTDTNADPHSAARGFFFSHMGWLMCKKHPDVKKYGNKIDMSDLERDPVVVFQHKYYYILMPVCHTVIPVAISMLCFGVSFHQAFFMNLYRYVTVLHFTWLVNSYAHFFGNKPFDKNIKPTDSYTVALLAFGEGWHNYHHVFPYDYKTSEHGKYWCNFTTGFIDFMAFIGWATDLKMIDPKIVYKRALRTGDGSLILKNNEYDESLLNVKEEGKFDEHIWGWQDESITADEKKDVTIINNTELS